jgi:hypothetical protein
MARVFVSYAHSEQTWVLDRLVPVLEAGNAEVVIDVRHFRAGRTVVGEMDRWQDTADRHLLVITRDYLASKPCRHERDRAIRCDPTFNNGIVLPIRRDDAPLPAKLTIPNPLYINLRDDRDADPWARLVQACDADLGVPAPRWLTARDEIERSLNKGRSVNLVVGNGTPWQPLLAHLRSRPGLEMPVIDLNSGAVADRPTLLQEMLRGLGSRAALPECPKDLLVFHNEITARGVSRVSRVALVHFDMAPYKFPNDVPLFAALRHLITDARKLALLVHSHAPFQTLLPRDHPLSEIDLTTVTLSATP